MRSDAAPGHSDGPEPSALTSDDPGLGPEAARALALRLFRAGLAAADPEAAVRRALGADPPGALGGALVLAAGKAASRMLDGAAGWIAELPRPPEILVATNRENARGAHGAGGEGRAGSGLGADPEAGDGRAFARAPTVFLAGHPVPDAEGLRAARAFEAALRAAGPDTRVLLLLSGGASALLPSPAPGLTLEDEAATARLLLASGASIEQVNLVRQHLSTLKGGGLARLAAPSPVTALILSDVVGDDLRAIGSGPTAGPLGTRAEAAALCRDLGIWDALPAAARARFVFAEPAEPTPAADNRVVGSNAISLAAMGAACPEARVHAEPLVGDVADAAARLLALPRGLHLLGGETTVRVTGSGTGGRNQELALRVAMGLRPCDVLLSAGTDGRDGPTDAAGGIVDGGTEGRIRAAGLDPEVLLADNDAHRALEAAGDLLVTGGTGTNVADLQVWVRPHAPPAP